MADDTFRYLTSIFIRQYFLHTTPLQSPVYVAFSYNVHYIKANAKDIITPILVTYESKFDEIDKNDNVVKSGDVIMEVK